MPLNNALPSITPVAHLQMQQHAPYTTPPHMMLSSAIIQHHGPSHLLPTPPTHANISLQQMFMLMLVMLVDADAVRVDAALQFAEPPPRS